MSNSSNTELSNLRFLTLANIFNFIKVPLFLLGFAILVNILFNLFTFTVPEYNQAIVVRFGSEIKQVILDTDNTSTGEDIKNDPRFRNVKIIYGKGLFFKAPFIDSVEYYDNRLLSYDTDPREATTQDKKKLILDNNGQWRIKNPLWFRLSVGNIRNANTRIDDIIYSRLNERIGKIDATLLISDKKIVTDMLDDLTKVVNIDVRSFGVEIVDSQLRKTDLPKENMANIYNRMKTEREQKAKQFRSEGKEEAQRITSEAEKEAQKIEALAYKEAEQIKGEGDAEATRIYNEAYNKDPEFYEFYRSLQAYKATLNNKTKIVIDSNSPFARYLFGTN